MTRLCGMLRDNLGKLGTSLLAWEWGTGWCQGWVSTLETYNHLECHLLSPAVDEMFAVAKASADIPIPVRLCLEIGSLMGNQDG